jgi:PAS domain S-box-containing protein
MRPPRQPSAGFPDPESPGPVDPGPVNSGPLNPGPLNPDVADPGPDIFRAAFDCAGLAMVITGPDLDPPGPRIRFANAAMAKLTGYSAEEMVGRTPRILQGQRTNRAMLAQLKSGLLQEGHFSGEAINYGKDGREYVVDWAITAVRGKDGVLQGWMAVQRDVTERRQARDALLASEERQRALVEGIPQLVWRATDGGDWTWSSPQWSAYTGLSKEESRGQGWLAALHPDDREGARAAWASAEAGTTLEMEGRLFHAGEGRYRWYQSRATPVRGEGRNTTEWLGTSTDIDDLRRLHNEQSVMIAELQHRTRNLIAVVRSTANRTLRDTGSLEEFHARFNDRLAALSRVQGLLSGLSGTERLTIEQLLQDELAAHGAFDKPGKVTLDGPAGINLRSGSVQTFAMAIHELTTNAVKYGALGQADGRLGISWGLDPLVDGGETWLSLTWAETGVTMPEGDTPPPSGYGRELIERALPFQLQARTTYALTRDGVRCTIAAPIVSRVPG